MPRGGCGRAARAALAAAPRALPERREVHRAAHMRRVSPLEPGDHELGGGGEPLRAQKGRHRRQQRRRRRPLRGLRRPHHTQGSACVRPCVRDRLGRPLSKGKGKPGPLWRGRGARGRGVPVAPTYRARGSVGSRRRSKMPERESFWRKSDGRTRTGTGTYPRECFPSRKERRAVGFGNACISAAQRVH